MGAFWSFFSRNIEMRAIILGLDGAGKTTLLYNLHLGEIVRTIPTIGFNVERVKYKNCNFEVYPSTEHGFAFPNRNTYVKEAAEKHWKKLINLFDKNLK